MKLTEIRINLCAGAHPAGGSSIRNNGPRLAGTGSRLRAFCSLTFDGTFVIRDVKLIEGNDGLFLAMPSRKLSDHCPCCAEKNHLRARFCNQCGERLNEDRHQQNRSGNGFQRPKLHADIAHPINVESRRAIEDQVLEAYVQEVERSRRPGYTPPNLDAEDFEFDDHAPAAVAGSTHARAPQAAVGVMPAMRQVGTGYRCR